jgi:predicted transcriptional regulator
MPTEELTLPEISKRMGIPYTTLATAAKQKRLRARQIGKIYLSTIPDVQAAIDTGRMRKRNRKG